VYNYCALHPYIDKFHINALRRKEKAILQFAMLPTMYRFYYGKTLWKHLQLLLFSFLGDVKQWKIYMYYSDGTHIYGVRLNNEGTELYPNTCPELLLEGDQFGRPTVLKKNRYFYILDATSTKAKVFRSPTALGSFSEKEELKVLCPIQYTWNNCSVSEKERVYRIACETNYLWAFSNSFDMPRRPGIAVLGWLNTGWPYIHNTKDAGDSCS